MGGKIGLIICYAVGIFFLLPFGIKEKKFLRWKKMFMGLIPLAGGLAGTYALYMEDTELLHALLWCTVGVEGICMSIFDLIKIRMCGTQIYGTFIKSRESRSNKMQTGIPTFRYTYGGVSYENESNEEVPLNMAKNYESGHTYPIYICENEPYLYITDRKNYGLIIFQIIIGIFIIVTAWL